MLDITKLSKSEKENEIKIIEPIVKELSLTLVKVEDFVAKRKILVNILFEKENEYKKIKEEFDNVRAILNDIKYTKREFSELQSKQEIMKLIQKALSSKDGIQLVFVNIFLPVIIICGLIAMANLSTAIMIAMACSVLFAPTQVPFFLRIEHILAEFKS
jgi:hypothetical protein